MNISFQVDWWTYKLQPNSADLVLSTLCFKKLCPFYFCNNFFIREPIFIIFGKNVAKEIGNMQSLTCLLLTVQMSYVLQLRTSLSVAGVAENMWCSTLKIAF